MNLKQKGSRNERFVRKFFEENYGYSITKSGGSLGIFDLIGVKKNYNNFPYKPFIMIQVKSNRMPPEKELKTILEFNNYPTNLGQKLIIVIKDGKPGISGRKKEIQIIEIL